MRNTVDERYPRILLIVIKNTSALDYTVPLLWKIKRVNPQADVSVLYCTLSQKTILRKSRFYSDVLSQCGIPEYDFADFLEDPYVRVRGLCRRVFSKSNWDSTPLQRFRHPLLRKPLRRMQRALARTEAFFTGKAVVQQVLPSLDPDIVLFDNRSVTAFHGRDYFYDHFARMKKKVVLLPHAPHHTGVTAFTPFDERGERLPDYCEVWMPFKFDRSWHKLPEKKSQFVYVGYPGLDSEWLAWLQSDDNPVKSRRQHRSDPSKPLQCLFIIRKFLEEGQSRPPGHDAYIFDHKEFVYYLDLVGDALRQADADIELIVKPHPSNDFPSVSRVFQASRIPRWRIAHDSIYEILPCCDFVISLYSTTLLIPAMAGIPVVVLHSRIQDEIHQWEEMKQLYTGLCFYLDNPDALPDRLNQVVEISRGRNEPGTAAWTTDIEHLRRFYPDGAMQRCLNRLKGMIP